jgi:hypothetical protein
VKRSRRSILPIKRSWMGAIAVILMVLLFLLARFQFALKVGR